MVNPNSGHTAANQPSAQDGLRDGDIITSPSLTNLVEGVHGNGILRLQDGAYDMVGRNEVTGDAPGFITRTGANTITVQGGYAVMDGVMYSFGGGPGNDQVLTLSGALAYCDSTPLGALQESLYVVYLCASSNAAHTQARIRIIGGTPVSQTGNVYPPIPSTSLINPNTILGAGELNGHSVILGVLRCRHGGPAPDMADIIEVNDKRTFVQSSARYFAPLNRNVGVATPSNNQSIDRKKNSGVNTDAHLKSLFNNADEDGDFGGTHGADRIDISGLWVSHQNWDTPAVTPPIAADSDYGLGIAGGIDPSATNTPTDVLYYSGQANSNQSLDAGAGMYTVRLGSRGVDSGTITIAGVVAWPITSYGDSVFIINVAGGGTLNLVPTGTFPEGHIIDVKCTGGTLQFNGNGVATYEKWVFDGNGWQQLV
jgi:hypothetical protein